ncbi:hypothetical protein PNOK_0428400 [Pyrrhoderma noxium]|uniref:Uncharacterized protein n=1 Tax=Pyrrhoderma noxium TaxID=2282107 RepID=A0A286UI96_9AGAM|nr:hypothetical protein PNOK_0428400 [Pyrrhoderma noxium]
MSLTTPLLTSSPSPSNVVTVANTTVNIIFGFIPGGETELVTSTLNASPVSSSRTTTTSEVSEPIRAVTTFKITTTGISQPFSTNTLTDIEKMSSLSLTEIEIGQSSYSGKTSQNVLTSVDPPHTNQATGTSLHRGNRPHLLSILLPTLIVGLLITQVDSNNCNRDAQEYNLKEVSFNTLTEGERFQGLASRHSQPMVEGPQRQNDPSMTLYNGFTGLDGMRRNQNDGNKNSVGQSINNVGSAGVELQHIAENPGLDNDTLHRPDMVYSTLGESVYGSPHFLVYRNLVYFRGHLDGIPESPPSYQELAHCDHPAAET